MVPGARHGRNVCRSDLNGLQRERVETGTSFLTTVASSLGGCNLRGLLYSLAPEKH
jgi:hypothetical protein